MFLCLKPVYVRDTISPQVYNQKETISEKLKSVQILLNPNDGDLRVMEQSNYSFS